MYRLKFIQVLTGNQLIPTATVAIEKKGDDAVVQETAHGEGPVEALYQAIDRATGLTLELEDYSLYSITKGKGALGEVTVKVSYNGGEPVAGRGTSTDIIMASAIAYVDVSNKVLKILEEKNVLLP